MYFKHRYIIKNREVKVKHVKNNKIVNNWVMVDFPDVMNQLGVDVFEGQGWEKFGNKKNKSQCHLDQNPIEDFIYRITQEIWENKKVECLIFASLYI